MRVVVVGIGAVGGLLAAELGRAGHDVAALARGATLAAVRDRGLLLRGTDREDAVAVEVSDDPAALGRPDLLVIALKAPAFAEVADRLAPLVGPGTTVLPAMNGVPWWFLGDGTRLTSIDPHGRIEQTMPLAQTLGCVVHLTASVPEPGVVAHGHGRRLIVGAPSGGPSRRADTVVDALSDAGFDVESSHDVRREIWYKLWGNMTVNPVSALTGATTDRILDDDLVRAFMVRAMAEAAEVGDRIGCPIAQSGEERLGLARALGTFKTSMMQDVEGDRQIELDALTGVVRELGERFGVPTPHVDALHGLTRLMGRSHGLYAGPD